MARLLSVKQVAELLGVSESTVRNWTNAGEIPHVRLPKGHRRYVDADILAFARKLGVEPGAMALAEPLADDEAESEDRR